MSYQVALNFEDGVTRVIACNEDETVLDAAYRHQIKLPMDCSDGVCGTCKGTCLQGSYDLGDEYIDEALTDDEAESGLILTCQMVVSSDAVVAIPAASTLCSSGPQSMDAEVTAVTALSDSTIELNLTLPEALGFLPGQYVNLGVPGTDQTRAYSFSSLPGETDVSFLIRNVPNGLMSTYLTSEAKPGDTMSVTGPIGSFYLRAVERPVLLLAGGTGLAPLLSMLKQLKKEPTEHPVFLLYGVTGTADLVKLDELSALASELENVNFATVLVDKESGHERIGFVTQHMDAVPFEIESADVYLCGPPPMVDAVRNYFSESGTQPNAFYYEKFNPSTPKQESAA